MVWAKLASVGARLITKVAKPKVIISGGKSVAKGANSIGSKVVSGTADIFKKVTSAVAGAVKSKTVHPILEEGVKKGSVTFVENLKRGAVAGALGYSAVYTPIKAVITGKTPNPTDVAKGTIKSSIVGAGLAGSPVIGTASLLKSTLERGGMGVSSTAKNFYNILRGQGQSIADKSINLGTNTFKDVADNLPTTPVPDINITYNLPEMGTIPTGTIPTAPQSFIFETPIQTPSPSFSPSVSLGGGGLGESMPLWIMLALGGGLAGFAIGKKRKRKKKKYKKRKRG